MADPTRARGPSDTRSRAFRLAIVVALILHVPLVPWGIGPWLQMLMAGDADYDDADASAIVPIDLDLVGGDTKPEATAAPEAPSPPPPKTDAEGPADAGAGHTPDAGAPRPRPEAPDAGADTKPDAGAPLRDPVKAAGGAGSIAAENPNVQILLNGSVLRKHEVGAWVGRLLVMIPEWRSFFEGTSIDPIRDVSHLLITGPSFRHGTGKTVAVMELSLPAERIRDVVDLVVHANDGVWLEDAPVTAARVRVGGAPRVLAILPDKRMLVLLPAEAMDQLDRLKHAKGFRSSPEAAVISLLTPARPFAPFFPLPESLKWMRVAITPARDGGADVAIEAGDASAEEARAHAASITEDFDARRKISVFGLGSTEIFEAVTFVAERDVIRGRTHIDGNKLKLILSVAEEQARHMFDAGPAPAPPPPTEH